jgi:FKBP-type peptidyl-prolyl cis-trans isomerase
MKEMMDKIAAGLGAILVLLTIVACNKSGEEGPDNQVLEREEIQTYADNNQLNGQFTNSGLYYVIENAGSDKHPGLASTITVSYRGYYLDGTVLDEGAFYTERLNRLIAGWQEGIPLIGEGGRIKLIIPSHLAYRNGIIVFDVTLHTFTG